MGCVEGKTNKEGKVINARIKYLRAKKKGRVRLSKQIKMDKIMSGEI